MRRVLHDWDVPSLFRLSTIFERLLHGLFFAAQPSALDCPADESLLFRSEVNFHCAGSFPTGYAARRGSYSAGPRWVPVLGSGIGNATSAPPGIADLQIGKVTYTTAS